MNYSTLSDFEINNAVHNATMKDPYKLEFLGNDRIKWTKKDSEVITEKVDYGKNTLKDYCNNPSDAWPIIVENKIDIIQDNGQGCPLASDSIQILVRDNEGTFYQDENPLRAAMIVFLMMQEGK